MTNVKFTHPKDASPEHDWETVGGIAVHQLTYFPEADFECQLVGLVRGKVYVWDGNGERESGGRLRLRDVPVKKYVWVNIHPYGCRAYFSHARALADNHDVLVSRIRVPYEVGKFDG